MRFKLYWRLLCYLDINECAKFPCKNGATCQNIAGSYQCACKPGYTDRNCETGRPPWKIKYHLLATWMRFNSLAGPYSKRAPLKIVLPSSCIELTVLLVSYSIYRYRRVCCISVSKRCLVSKSSWKLPMQVYVRIYWTKLSNWWVFLRLKVLLGTRTFILPSFEFF